jgi:hypothetical protein
MKTLQIETSVSQTPLARRSVVTITLTGGDPAQREATVQSILSWLAMQAPAATEPAPPALAPVFALLSCPPPPAEDVRPTSHPRLMVTGYDEPFLLAPLDPEHVA